MILMIIITVIVGFLLLISTSLKYGIYLQYVKIEFSIKRLKFEFKAKEKDAPSCKK